MTSRLKCAWVMFKTCLAMVRAGTMPVLTIGYRNADEGQELFLYHSDWLYQREIIQTLRTMLELMERNQCQRT